jgi:guanylate kinase
MEELERRLRGRLTENADEIERRQADARQEMEQIPNYDYVVENDTVRAAAETIKAILIAEHCRIK